MLGSIAGLISGIAVLGGWWSLLGFCLVVSIALGSWRVHGAYRRLGSAENHVRKPSDALNLALISDAPNPEETAVNIIESGQLPEPTFRMYWRACIWEFMMMTAFATVARLAKTYVFSP